jgi:hypothetical protein
MALFSLSKLKERINKFIYENFTQAITSEVLNGILHDITDSLVKAIIAADVAFVHPIYNNVQDALNAVFNFIDGPGYKCIISKNKNASYYILIPFDSDFLEISFRKISGTPSVKMGILPGGDDILELTEITYKHTFDIPKYFQATGPIYISVTGGTVTSNAVYYGKRFDMEEQRAFDDTFDETFN